LSVPDVAPAAIAVDPAHPPPARAGDLFTPAYRGLTLGLVSTITLIAVESLAIGTVMPQVVKELGDQELYGWVYSAFYLGNMLGIVLVGAALDRVPVRRPFAVGLALYGAGLVVAGLAPSMPILIAARFVQGSGGGSLTPTSYVAIGRRLPSHLQPPMFALMSAAWVVPGLIGPTIAAFVGATVGWRWVFLGLLPLLVLAGSLALRALGSVPAARHGEGDPAREAMTRRMPFALLAIAGAGIAIAALTAPEPPVIVLGTALGLAMLLPAFRRLTPPGTLRAAPGVPAAVLLRGAMTFSFFAADGFVALLLQTWRGASLVLTGIVFTITTVAWSGATWFQAKRIDRWGVVPFTRLGFGLVAAGAALSIPVVLPGVPPAVLAVTWVLPGIGMGLMYSAVTLVVLRRSRPAEQGAATASLQLADILGTALGVGVGGAIAAAGTRAGGNGLGVALGAVFALSAAVAALGALGSGRLGSASGTGGAEAAAVD
jgi:MFS family permease